ncbi:MAG: hypothetical protein CM15mP74_27040 [Halieaceae bacterium]|nr:MAG: hypothetical protein CM15mP74_27040 [Halieaceae bacterium]
MPPSMLIGKSCSMSGFVQYFHQAISGGAEMAATHKALADGSWRIPIERSLIWPISRKRIGRGRRGAYSGGLSSVLAESFSDYDECGEWPP